MRKVRRHARCPASRALLFPLPPHLSPPGPAQPSPPRQQRLLHLCTAQHLWLLLWLLLLFFLFLLLLLLATRLRQGRRAGGPSARAAAPPHLAAAGRRWWQDNSSCGRQAAAPHLCFGPGRGKTHACMFPAPWRQRPAPRPRHLGPSHHCQCRTRPSSSGWPSPCAAPCSACRATARGSASRSGCARGRRRLRARSRPLPRLPPPAPRQSRREGGSALGRLNSSRTAGGQARLASEKGSRCPSRLPRSRSLTCAARRLRWNSAMAGRKSSQKSALLWCLVRLLWGGGGNAR